MATQQNIEEKLWNKISLEKIAEVIIIQEFHSIYKLKRSRIASNSNLHSPKKWSTYRDYRPTKSAEDQPSSSKHETLPPSYNDS